VSPRSWPVLPGDPTNQACVLLTPRAIPRYGNLGLADTPCGRSLFQLLDHAGIPAALTKTHCRIAVLSNGDPNMEAAKEQHGIPVVEALCVAVVGLLKCASCEFLKSAELPTLARYSSHLVENH